ncbi:hypothetical protein [Marinicella sp. W31]|uniref:hypothetical protein n=1 Tax=Marinicella sp. W31 TaxID=3023713 RepID=UPI003758090A
MRDFKTYLFLSFFMTQTVYAGDLFIENNDVIETITDCTVIWQSQINETGQTKWSYMDLQCPGYVPSVTDVAPATTVYVNGLPYTCPLELAAFSSNDVFQIHIDCSDPIPPDNASK